MWIHIHVSSSKMIGMLDELGPKTISGEGSQCLCWRQRLKTAIEINNLSTLLCLESSSRMWSQLRRERLHFGMERHSKVEIKIRHQIKMLREKLQAAIQESHKLHLQAAFVIDVKVPQCDNQLEYWILWTTQVAHQQCSAEIKHPWLEALRILTSSLWLPEVLCGAAFFSVCWVQSRVLGHWALSLAQWREFLD